LKFSFAATRSPDLGQRGMQVVIGSDYSDYAGQPEPVRAAQPEDLD
jgi:hypothetical protein